MSLQVSTFVNGRWRQNCHLIADRQKDVLIVDPGSDAPKPGGLSKDSALSASNRSRFP